MRRRPTLAWALGVAIVLAAMIPASALASYAYEFHPFTANDGAQTGDDSTCDAGDVVVGGGMASGGAGYAEGLYLNTSRPGSLAGVSKTAWTVYVDNYAGGSASLTPRVYAICDQNGRERDYRIRSDSFLVPDNSQGEKVVRCAKGEIAVGGGGNSSGFYADETYLPTSAPFDGGDRDRRPDDGWRVALNNDEDVAALDATGGVFVVCDRKHDASGFSYAKRSKSVPDGAQRSALARCPADQDLVGGGVQSHAAYKHGLYINTTFPNVIADGELWVGAVDNYDTPDDEARKITTTAICKR